MPTTFPPARLEAFSDGVIAVIITIMVLELKVPAAGGWAGLHLLIPTLLVYMLSYTFIGVYWVNHNQLIHRLKRSNSRILWANLIWLFALSLIPFFTNFVIDKHADSSSVEVYSACMLLTGATFLLLRYAVDCQRTNDGELTQVDRATQVKHWGSLALYAASFFTAPWMPRGALLLDSAVTLVWILPTLGLGKKASAHDEKNETEDSGAAPQPSRSNRSPDGVE